MIVLRGGVAFSKVGAARFPAVVGAATLASKTDAQSAHAARQVLTFGDSRLGDAVLASTAAMMPPAIAPGTTSSRESSTVVVNLPRC